MSGALSQGPAGGIVPQGSAATNPMMANMASQYANLPTEKLQELAARAGGSPQGALAQRVLQQRQIMSAQQPQAQSQGSGIAPQAGAQAAGTPITQTPQATAAGVTLPPTTNAMQRGGGIVRPHFDMGGVPTSQEDPWWTRSEARDESGLIRGSTPGRTDTVNMEPLAGSHIIPADVVSGAGEGNTDAGAAVWTRLLDAGPDGTPMPRGVHGRGPPAPPRVYNRQFDSRGGAATGKGRVPIVAANGEMVASPEQVSRLGGGDLKRGHDILDALILEIRRRTIRDMRKLPPPKKK